MLQDALDEMVIAYRELDKEIHRGGALIEAMPVEGAESTIVEVVL